MTVNETISAINELTDMSLHTINTAYADGILDYARELLENVDESERNISYTDVYDRGLYRKLYAGAPSAMSYSKDGFSLCYDSQIASRLGLWSDYMDGKINSEKLLQKQAAAILKAVNLIDTIIKINTI